MSDSDLEQERKLFERCITRPVEQWDAFLDNECAGDAPLRTRVRRMLDHYRETWNEQSGFLRLDGKDPERIGPYRLLQRLGEGGMGIVYAAEQREPVRRRVAIKVLRGGYESREVLARFDVERQALSLMTHENIARILDAGTTPDHRPYIVMEFVPGEPVSRFCQRTGLSIRQRLELFSAICDAIQHAHQKGVIHRDIKPSNILVMQEEGRAVAKIIDFGIAKAVAQPLTAHTLETQIGSMLGTPDYMSPEQVELSPLDVDTRADVYALGAVLYELLCGAPPFNFRDGQQSYLEIQRIVRDTEASPPSTRLDGATARKVRGELDWVTLKALQKDRNQRYGSAAELADDVRRVLNEEATVAGPPSRLRHVKKFVRRNRAAVALASVALLTLAGLALSMTLQSRWLLEERDRANREAEIANETSAFLVDLFRAGDPYSGGQRGLDTDILLNDAIERIEDTMPTASAVRVRLYRALGRIHLNLGHYKEGDRVLQRSLRDAKQLYGENHLETLQSRRELVVALVHRGQWQEAINEIEDIVEMRRALLGEDDVENFRLLANLGSTLYRTGNTDRALRLLEQAAAGLRDLLGPEHANVLGINNNLALLYRELGRIDEARALLEQLVETSATVLGELHPQTLGATFNLVDLHRETGDNESAATVYARLLESQRAGLGEEHPDTLMTRYSLAPLHAEPETRKTEMRAVLELRNKVLGSDHPLVQQTRIQAALMLSEDSSSLEERERLLETALGKMSSQLGTGNESYRLGQVLLAEVRAEQLRMREATVLLREAQQAGESLSSYLEDPDFAQLRDTPEFRELLQAVVNDGTR